MKVHFIGIGGIGMSALARYYLANGHLVTGSDDYNSDMLDELIREGVTMQDVPSDADRVVISNAISRSHEGALEASSRGSEVMTYPEALGEITKEYYTIGVSGTHGKSTTTAMLGIMMQEAGLDPTVIVGTKVKEFGGSNMRMGRGQYLVIEADEYKEAFLHYTLDIGVLTTVELDHVDHFKDYNGVLRAFARFVDTIRPQGSLVMNKDDKGVGDLSEMLTRSDIEVSYYSSQEQQYDELRNVLQVPGDHNVSNAMCVLKVAEILGVSINDAKDSLAEFTGTWRRFEVFEKENCTIVSDYGHHPTEVKATMSAARSKWPNRPLWLVFQPHQYHRTRALYDDFVSVLSAVPADRIILTDIYDVPGREDQDIRSKVNSEMLLKDIRSNAVHIPNHEDVRSYLSGNLKGGEVVVIMGAGNIYELIKTLTPLSRI